MQKGKLNLDFNQLERWSLGGIKVGDFYTNFEKQIISAVNLDFFELLKKVNDEKVYAVSLVVDSDISGLFLVFNTIEYLKKQR